MRVFSRVTWWMTTCIVAASICAAHGGTYAGPGDTVPAGGHGGTGGTPTTPGSGGGQPGLPGNGNPLGPNTPAGGQPLGPPTPGGAGGRGPGTPDGAGEPDLTRWQFWWELNKEPFLDLRAHLRAAAPMTDSDQIFVGRGAVDARDDLRVSAEKVRNVVVPALLAALADKSSNDVVTGAMLALARIGDQNDESGTSQIALALRPFLMDNNQEIAETTALALGVLGNAASVDVLSQLLASDRAALADLDLHFTSAVPERTRAFAAYALGLIGRTAGETTRATIVAALTRVLTNPDADLRRRDVPVACVLSLGLTPLASDPLFPALADDAAPPRSMRAVSREAQVVLLLGLLENPRGEALLRAHVPRSVAALVADLPSEHWLKRRVARALIVALSEFSGEKVYVQQAAALALGQVGDCDDDEIDALIRTTLMSVPSNVEDVQTRRFALMALAQVGGRAGRGGFSALDGKKGVRSFLAERLSKGGANERCWAALALGVLENELIEARGPTSSDVRETLVLHLNAMRSGDDVGAAAIAVGLARVRGARDVLIEKLDKISEDDARGYVALGLGLIGDEGAVAPIQEVVAKSRFHPDLLRQTAIALGLLGDRRAVDGLIDMLATSNSAASQAAVAAALGQIGNAHSVDPLVAMLADRQKTGLSRGFAAAALGLVADKEELTWRAALSVNLDYRANTETLTTPKDGTGILDIL